MSDRSDLGMVMEIRIYPRKGKAEAETLFRV